MSDLRGRWWQALGLATAMGLFPQVAARAGTIPSLVMQPVNDAVRVVLPGNVHPLARPEYDHGLAADSLSMNRMLLVLKRSPQQEAALDQLLLGQQDKSSPNYHRWLIPQEFGAKFGPSDSDIQAVTDWLTSEAFTVDRVSNGRTVVEFSGTAGLVRQVFRAEIHNYVIDGKSYWANATNPQIPAALAPVVKGIASLNNFPRQLMYRLVGAFSRSKTTGEIKPLYTALCPTGYKCSFQALYALGPTDFATIYNVLPLWNAGIDGSGETIAIPADSNINPQDVANFRSLFGLPANPVKVIVDGPDPGIVPAVETEADLDTEWAGAVAKGATIDLVVSEDTETTFGFDLSALYIIDNDLAPVMSESYGACESNLGVAGNAFENAIAEQAAAEGITVVVAAGDNGSAGCDFPALEDAAKHGLAVSGNASTLFNVAVGGTDFDDPSSYFSSASNSTTQNSAKSYVPEITWNDSCARGGQTSGCGSIDPYGFDLVAGSGGESNCAVQDSSGNCTAGYPKPAWQTGTGVPQDGVRDVPDVSLFAGDGFDDAFYIICASDQFGLTKSGSASCTQSLSTFDFLGVGGTSVAAPAFAGIMALVNQKTGQRQGNANFVLYPLAATAGSNGDDCPSSSAAVSNGSCVFYDITKGHNSSGTDITPGNNSVACVAGSLDCSATTSSTSAYGILINPSDTTPTPAWTTNTGYDLATGLGSVNAANMVNDWSSVSFHSSGTKLGLSPMTITHGQSVTANITVTSSSGTPTGDVELMGNPKTIADPAGSGSIGIADFKLGSGGTVSGTTNMLPGGTYNVFAHYAGDGINGSSDSQPVNVTVNPEDSQMQVKLVTYDPFTGQVTNPGTLTVPYDSWFLLRLDVTNGSGNFCAPQATLPQYACPTGSVTVTSSDAPLLGGTYGLNSQGYAENQKIQSAQLFGGTYAMTATYNGDNSYNPSTKTASIVVTPAPSSTDLPALPNYVTQVSVGTQTTIETSVEGHTTGDFGVAPTGTVTFYMDGSVLPGTVTYTSVPPNPPYGSLFNAKENIQFLTSGMHVITATYSGDSNYQLSTSPAANIHAVYTPAVTVSVSPQIVFAGTPVTASVLVDTTNKNLPPTGSVVMCCSVSGSYQLSPTTDAVGNSAAEATLTFKPGGNSQPGVESTFATYPGDTNYAQAQSSSVSLTVFPSGTSGDFLLQDQPDYVNVSAPGMSGSTTISVAPSPGISGIVALSCAIPSTMAEAACSFSPASLSLTDQQISSAKLTVTTTAPHAVGEFIPRPRGFGSGWGGVFLVCLLLLAVSLLARRPRLLAPALLIVLLAVGALSCGGGGGGGGGSGPPSTDPGTPTGLYSVIITATETINGSPVTHTVSFTVNLE